MKDFVFYSKGIEYKSFFDEKSNSQRYFVKGHISSEDLDLVNDIVTKNCMVDIENQLKSRNIKLDFDHETLRKSRGDDDVDAQLNLSKIPLGKSISHDVDEKGNFVEFELNPNWKKFDSKGNVVMTFKEVWDNVKSGFYDAFSIAYVPVKTASQMVGDVKARLLDKVNLINVALTGNPINPTATMTNVFAKSLNYLSEYEELKSELREIKNMIGGNMTKEKKSEEVEQTAPVEGTQKEAPKEEVKEEKSGCKEKKDEDEDKEKEKKEEKSVELDEAKSFVELKSRIDVLEKSLEKINTFLEQSIPKGLGAEDKSVKQEQVAVNEKSNSTLDLI